MLEVVWTVSVICCVLLPVLLPPLLWRRMKRIRNEAYRNRDTIPKQEAWQETVAGDSDLALDRSYRPNDALIDLGDRARHGRWPLDNA